MLQPFSNKEKGEELTCDRVLAASLIAKNIAKLKGGQEPVSAKKSDPKKVASKKAPIKKKKTVKKKK